MNLNKKIVQYSQVEIHLASFCLVDEL